MSRAIKGSGFRGTIDELFEAEVVRKIFGAVTGAWKIRDGPGVLVKCLCGVEGAQAVARLRDSLPMRTLGLRDGHARTGGKLAKIFGAHAAS